MKSSQQIAEEMARQAGLNHDPEEAIRTAILREIPITQLIEVARAAKVDAGPRSMCCMSGEATGELCELHQALDALKQTGKADWLNS